jgi:hypothetical protein
MKTRSWFHFLAALEIAAASLSVTADARGVRTYSGGQGYHYRVPSIDGQLSRWQESRLIPSARGRQTRHGIAPLGFSTGSLVPFVQMEFAGKILIVPRKNVIETVQRSLAGLGYYRGPASGTMNRDFEQALRKYQAESGARNSGVVDADTLDSLGLNAASFTR